MTSGDESTITRITPEAFEESRVRLQSLRGTTVELYRLIAVEGMRQTEAAAVVGISKQNASQQLKRVKALLANRPSDWVCVTVWLPKGLARKVMEMEREALKGSK